MQKSTLQWRGDLERPPNSYTIEIWFSPPIVESEHSLADSKEKRNFLFLFHFFRTGVCWGRC